MTRETLLDDTESKCQETKTGVGVSRWLKVQSMLPGDLSLDSRIHIRWFTTSSNSRSKRSDAYGPHGHLHALYNPLHTQTQFKIEIQGKN